MSGRAAWLVDDFMTLPPVMDWLKEGVRSKFSVSDLREDKAVSPNIGPDPEFFNRLLW